jgi:tRNA pseudouridine synthase D (TruD)
MLQAALSLLSRMLHCSPGVFGFAGTKDKRAVGRQPDAADNSCFTRFIS